MEVILILGLLAVAITIFAIKEDARQKKELKEVESLIAIDELLAKKRVVKKAAKKAVKKAVKKTAKKTAPKPKKKATKKKATKKKA